MSAPLPLQLTLLKLANWFEEKVNTGGKVCVCNLLASTTIIIIQLFGVFSHKNFWQEEVDFVFGFPASFPFIWTWNQIYLFTTLLFVLLFYLFPNFPQFPALLSYFQLIDWSKYATYTKVITSHVWNEPNENWMVSVCRGVSPSLFCQSAPPNMETVSGFTFIIPFLH